MRECSFFFFQAEDGIRDLYVTGVQTCALPICWLGFGGCTDRAEPWTTARTNSIWADRPNIGLADGGLHDDSLLFSWFHQRLDGEGSLNMFTIDFEPVGRRGECANDQSLLDCA